MDGGGIPGLAHDHPLIQQAIAAGAAIARQRRVPRTGGGGAFVAQAEPATVRAAEHQAAAGVAGIVVGQLQRRQRRVRIGRIGQAGPRTARRWRARGIAHRPHRHLQGRALGSHLQRRLPAVNPQHYASRLEPVAPAAVAGRHVVVELVAIVCDEACLEAARAPGTEGDQCRRGGIGRSEAHRRRPPVHQIGADPGQWRRRG
jgi:hypothetical protein